MKLMYKFPTLVLLIGCLVRGHLIIDANQCASGVHVDVLNPLYTTFFGLNRVTLATRIWMVFNSGLVYRRGLELVIGSARQYINGNATNVEVTIPHADREGRVLVSYVLGGTRIKREFYKSHSGRDDAEPEAVYRLTSEFAPVTRPLSGVPISEDPHDLKIPLSSTLESDSNLLVSGDDENDNDELQVEDENSGEFNKTSQDVQATESCESLSTESLESQLQSGTHARRGSTSSNTTATSTTAAGGSSGPRLIERIKKAFKGNAPLDLSDDNLEDDVIVWRKVQVLDANVELVCLRLVNADNACNRVQLNKVNIPVPCSSSHFEVAIIKMDTSSDNQEITGQHHEHRILVASHISEVWVEAYYSIVNDKLLPCNDFDAFKGANVLTSRQVQIDDVEAAHFETLELDLFNEQWLETSDAVDFIKSENCQLLRPSWFIDKDAKSIRCIDDVKFGKNSVKIEHSNSLEFAMAATCMFDAQVWVLIVTVPRQRHEKQWLYTLGLWRGSSKESTFIEVNYNSPASILPMFYRVYNAMQHLYSPSKWSEVELICNVIKEDKVDLLCLGNISLISKRSYAGCKSLQQLNTFEGVMLGAVFNVIKFKADTDNDRKSIVHIGNVLIELHSDLEENCDIYYAQEPDRQRQVLLKCPTSTRALAEVGPNTNQLVLVDDSWARAPLHTKRVNVDIGVKSWAVDNDFTWKLDPNTDRWVLSPKYPGISLGDVVYGNKVVKCGSGRGCGYASVSKANLQDGQQGGVRVHLARCGASSAFTIAVGLSIWQQQNL